MNKAKVLLDKGYKVPVQQEEGTVEGNQYTLAPDVREYFADSQVVNEAPRSLIHLAEKVPGRKYRPAQDGCPAGC
jgi:hypothetical protein